ncbi:hypothetical protein R1sor_006917 [Riccia sorocarpa]|uniref:Uncharacterized protein n=1 Tax=Riccia sorocarpa TaxID=122646 RepID=A0ABD3HT16_9MARC
MERNKMQFQQINHYKGLNQILQETEEEIEALIHRQGLTEKHREHFMEARRSTAKWKSQTRRWLSGDTSKHHNQIEDPTDLLTQEARNNLHPQTAINQEWDAHYMIRCDWEHEAERNDDGTRSRRTRTTRITRRRPRTPERAPTNQHQVLLQTRERIAQTLASWLRPQPEEPHTLPTLREPNVAPEDTDGNWITFDTVNDLVTAVLPTNEHGNQGDGIRRVLDTSANVVPTPLCVFTSGEGKVFDGT